MATATKPQDTFKNFTNFDWAKFDLSDIEIPQSLEEWENEINANLDKLEANLPVPFDSMLHLQRTIWDTAYTMTKVAGESVNEASEAIIEQAKASAERLKETFNKQSEAVQEDFTRMTEATRHAVTDVAKTVERTNDKVADTVSNLADEAADYSAWTKDELYDRAQELNIEGRSGMSKSELVKAVKTATK